MRQNIVENYSVTKGNTVSGSSENYYEIYIPTFSVLLYPFALIVFSMLSEVRALIICCTVLYKYTRTFYIRLPRQFNLHAHCLDRVSIHHPLPTFPIFTKRKQKTEMWSLCLWWW